MLGNLICTVGHIVTASKRSANSVIAGMAISGFGGGNCQMAAFALSELLPNKWRHIGVIIADITTIMAVIIGPVSGRIGIENGNWQWNFWAAAIAQFLSFLGLLFLYFPPAHPYVRHSLTKQKTSNVAADMASPFDRWSKRLTMSVRQAQYPSH